MNHLAFRSQLDAFLEGTLQGDARARFLGHAQECAPCREELAAIQGIAADAAALSRTLDPPSDLWPRIARGLPSSARSSARAGSWEGWMSRVRPLLAAAAALAVFWAATLVAPHRSEGPKTESRISSEEHAENAPADLTVISNSAKPLPSAWARMIWGLEEESLGAERAVFTGLSGRIDADALTRANTVLPGLRALDDAIGETASALRQHPDDPELARTLTAYYEQKLELLRLAARLASGSWA
jgi:putative zinc finger protein